MFLSITFWVDAQKVIVSDYLGKTLEEVNITTEESKIVSEDIRTFYLHRYQDWIVTRGGWNSFYLLDAHTLKVEQELFGDLEDIANYAINNVLGHITYTDEVGNLQIIDIHSRQKSEILVLGHETHQILFSKDGTTTYVLGYDKSIKVIQNLKVIKTIEFPLDTGAMDISFDTQELYVLNSNGYDGFLTIIDLMTFKKKWTMKVGILPLFVKSYSRNQKLFVSCLYQEKLYVVDKHSKEIVREISFPTSLGDLVIDEKRNLFYALDKHSIHVFSLQDYHKIKSIEVSGMPCDLYLPKNDKNLQESEVEIHD